MGFEWRRGRASRICVVSTVLAIAALAPACALPSPSSTSSPTAPADVLDSLPWQARGLPILYTRSGWERAMERPAPVLQALARAGRDPRLVREAVGWWDGDPELMVVAYAVPEMDMEALTDAAIRLWAFEGEVRWEESIADHRVIRAGPHYSARERDAYFLALHEMAVTIVSDDRLAVEEVIAHLPD